MSRRSFVIIPEIETITFKEIYNGVKIVEKKLAFTFCVYEQKEFFLLRI